ncbi:MAG: S41 family peptidase [Chloroflexota bacterium]
MTNNPGASGPNPEPPRRSVSVGLVAVLLLTLSAAVIFAAGLSLGGQTGGRDAGERAALEAFVETYRRISDDFVGEADPEALLEGAIRGMFDTLDDPYSAYMDAEEYEATFAGISGEFEGIGARMGTIDGAGLTCEPIGERCRLRVTEVLPESPALAAGLMKDDVVTAVDKNGLSGQTIDDAVLLIRGPRGSEVTLTLDRDGSEYALTITRDTILSQDVRSAVLADGRVGYLRVDSFSSSAADDFRDQLKTHLDSGIERLVVDVRGDPGGFVTAAVAITSQFIADGPVFWEEAADGTRRSIDAISGGLATDPAIELVVLIDQGSASASEILAGALRDAGRARLVGETTFGKGTVQEWTRLPGDNGGFRLSVSKWLTRDKDWVHGVGLTPDERVSADGERYQPGGGADVLGDAQLERAVSLLLPEEVTATPGAEPPTAARPDAGAGAKSSAAPSAE